VAGSLNGVPIFLIGMMGSGKSTVGDLFAKSLGSYSFVDTDGIIEKVTGTSVAEVFESEGEAGFRALETAVLTQVQAYVRTVVATGGGVVTVDENWGRLQSGVVVFLDVGAETIAKRIVESDGVKQGGVSSRPLLADLADPTDVSAVAEKIQGLLDQRLIKYQQADVVVSLGESDALDDCALKVISGIEDFIASNPPKWKQWKEKIALQKGGGVKPE